jgi:predicted component of type VI protein secretion system
LYETLYGNFTGGLDLHQVSEQNQTIISVLDNMQRILNCRAGTLAHLPDYGLPDMTKILQGMPGTAHELMGTLSAVLLKYEPRLKKLMWFCLSKILRVNCVMPLMPNFGASAWCATARRSCPKAVC